MTRNDRSRSAKYAQEEPGAGGSWHEPISASGIRAQRLRNARMDRHQTLAMEFGFPNQQDASIEIDIRGPRPGPDTPASAATHSVPSCAAGASRPREAGRGATAGQRVAADSVAGSSRDKSGEALQDLTRRAHVGRRELGQRHSAPQSTADRSEPGKDGAWASNGAEPDDGERRRIDPRHPGNGASHPTRRAARSSRSNGRRAGCRAGGQEVSDSDEAPERGRSPGPPEHSDAVPVTQTAADKGTVHRIANSWNTQRPVERGSVSHEQDTACGLRSSLLQVLGEGLTGSHRQRNWHWSTDRLPSQLTSPINIESDLDSMSGSFTPPHPCTGAAEESPAADFKKRSSCLERGRASSSN